MSVYNMQGVRENVEKHLQEDLHLSEKYTLSKKEFNIFWIVFQASKYYSTLEFFKHWSFYLTDEVVDEIIYDDDVLKRMYMYEDFDMQECLEEGKSELSMGGFCQINDDLWLINDLED